MTRVMCKHCERPKKTCICCYFSPVENKVNVVILQHPSEVKQSKGSLPILKHSLSRCYVFVGEDFGDNTQLQALLQKHSHEIALLYPSEHAEVISDESQRRLQAKQNITTLIVLDGTWKKAFKMFQVNSFLHELIHVKLPIDIESLYTVRKTKKSGGLSTLEACCHALSALEDEDKKYQKLLRNFIKFNEMQLAFRK